MVHATQALEEATSAWNLYKKGKLDESKVRAERAAQLLAERYRYRFLFVVVDANISLLIALAKPLV